MPRKWFLYHKWWIGSLQTHVSWHFLGIQRIDSPLKYSKALVGRSSSFSDGGHEQGGFWQESRILEEIEMLCWSERWWFQSFKHLFIIFTFFITTWENDPIWLILVSTGSKPPPSDAFWCFFWDTAVFQVQSRVLMDDRWWRIGSVPWQQRREM